MSHNFETALRTYLECNAETENLHKACDDIAPYMLTYDAHRVTLQMLLWTHGALLAAIILTAYFAGHLHSVAAGTFFYLPLLICFAFVTYVFGVQVERIYVMRFFGFAVFILSLTMIVVVLYAVYANPRMSRGVDIALLCLQGVDVFLAIGYFVTIEQLAAVGCDLTMLVERLHAAGLVVSPIHHKCGNAELTRRHWFQSFLLWIRASPATPHDHFE